MTKIISARDLAREIGFEFDTPEFWRWCKGFGLEPTVGTSGFDFDEAMDFLRQERSSGRLMLLNQTRPRGRS